MRPSLFTAVFGLIFASSALAQTCANGQCAAPAPQYVYHMAPASVPPMPAPQACPPAAYGHAPVAHHGYRGWYPGRCLRRIFRCH